MTKYAWSLVAITMSALPLSACGGDPEAGDECEFKETGDVFCGEGGAVLECTFVNAARQWSQVDTCASGTSCRATDSVEGYVCE